jgi:hypothetical protein
MTYLVLVPQPGGRGETREKRVRREILDRRDMISSVSVALVRVPRRV